MIYNIIATGSSGNAVVIDHRILIDCGVPYKMLRPWAANLQLVLLTHEHGDHFKPGTVRALHRERPTLRWGCCRWMVRHLIQTGVDRRVIDVLDLRRFVRYEGLDISVSPVPVFHNVPNCGYKVLIHSGALFYATDTGTLDGIEAKSYDLYMIEANHTQAEIEERIRTKEAAGEFIYETAAAQNHLSREHALAWLAENMGPNSRYVFLHQHQEKELLNDSMDTGIQQSSPSPEGVTAGG